jgi:hypothetical protein
VLLGAAGGAAWAQDTVRVYFVDATPAKVVAWAAEATGRDGYVAEGTTGEIDVRTGAVTPEAALNAVVDGLESAGLRVTITEVAVVVRDPALPADARLVAVWRAAPAGIPTSDCPGVTSRAALGLIAAPVRVFGSPVRPSEGAAPGLRLSGIPRGGPVAALGLRSGDVLEALDGPVLWRPDDGIVALKATLGAVLEINAPASFRVRRRGDAHEWTCHVKRRETGAKREETDVKRRETDPERRETERRETDAP